MHGGIMAEKKEETGCCSGFKNKLKALFSSCCAAKKDS